MSAQFYIASIKHTSKSHEHITFWGENYRGYVLVIKDGHTGAYDAEFIAKDGHLNDGVCCLAVSKAEVEKLLSPEPYFRNGRGVAARFYDTPGPVVENTRANWDHLIAVAFLLPRNVNPRPDVFRGKRRAFAINSSVAAGSTS